jgi:hypothetical protein
MQAFMGIGYFVLGIVQCAAIFSGMAEWTGFHWIVAAPLALFVAYIPLVGTILGIFGAMSAWGWSGLQAAGLFFGPFAVILVLGLLAGGVDSFSRARPQ